MTLLEGILWLTLNVYYEARSESIEGQVAVAHVTLNRWKKSDGKSIKEIVLTPKQFSWTNNIEENGILPENPRAFYKCLQSVYIALQTPDKDKKIFYHNKKIKPYWADKYIYVTTIGSHKFYTVNY